MRSILDEIMLYFLLESNIGSSKTAYRIVIVAKHQKEASLESLTSLHNTRARNISFADEAGAATDTLHSCATANKIQDYYHGLIVDKSDPNLNLGSIETLLPNTCADDNW